ncbi:MAG: hypothetical protein HY602_01810 [Parcubacteria group bacterium]|nr:hypothetical protein [Parcubacteria group bacterium]
MNIKKITIILGIILVLLILLGMLSYKYVWALVGRDFALYKINLIPPNAILCVPCTLNCNPNGGALPACVICPPSYVETKSQYGIICLPPIAKNQRPVLGARQCIGKYLIGGTFPTSNYFSCS